MKKRDGMEWYVYYRDINHNAIKPYNVLHGRYDAIKKMKKKCETFDEFSKALRSEMMYYYWSKFEWELTVSAYGPTDGSEAIKIDVFDQLVLNWDKFVAYCWDYVS